MKCVHCGRPLVVCGSAVTTDVKTWASAQLTLMRCLCRRTLVGTGSVHPREEKK